MSTYRDTLNAFLQHPDAAKFLHVLSIMEGTAGVQNPYLAAGGKNNTVLDSNYSTHPYLQGKGIWTFKNRDGTIKKSTSNGRYMIRYPTWQEAEKRLGKLDFSPGSQDLVAAHLIHQRGAAQDILNGNYNAAIQKLGREWASLPTAPDSYKQFKHGWDGLRNAFATAGLDYTKLHGTATPVIQKQNAPALSSSMFPAAPAANPKSSTDFLQTMFKPPAGVEFDEVNYTQRVGQPQEYKPIQWLVKPQGLYGG